MSLLPSGLFLAAGSAGLEPREILLQLFIILAAAQLAALLFRKIRQPVVVGEILVGVLLGPSVLGWVSMNPHNPAELSEPLFALAELGVIVLMFTVGLETPVKSIQKVGGAAFAVAVGGVILPFVFGWAAMTLLGHDSIESLFVGTAMVATSVGVTARVLGELGVIDREFAKIILGAAVIDDILGLLVLAVVSGMAKDGINIADLALTIGLTIVFIGVLLTVGPHAVRRVKPRLQASGPTTSFLLSLVLLVGLAAAASYIGLAAIVGAFLAGVILAEEVEDIELVGQVETLGAFLTPIFFVGVGAAVDLGALGTLSGLGLTALIVALAMIGKFVGSGLAARAFGSDTLQAVTIGVGMIPRGEVGIIVATIGLSAGAIDSKIFGVVVAMSVITTIVAPLPLSALIRRGDRRRDLSASSV